MSWLAILALVNLSAWGVFAYFVSRGRWTKASLAVGLLHMLLITPLGIAPLRAVFEPNTFGYGFGWIQVTGAIAAVPALTIWTWGLTAALSAVRNGAGRAMALIGVGDLAMAANFGTFFTVMALRGEFGNAKIQAGEYFTLTGLAVPVLVVLVFAVPFTFSAFWALCHIRSSGPTKPAESSASSRSRRRNDGENSSPDGGHLRVISAS